MRWFAFRGHALWKRPSFKNETGALRKRQVLGEKGGVCSEGRALRARDGWFPSAVSGSLTSRGVLPWTPVEHGQSSHAFPFFCFLQFSSVQLLSCVWLFATPWTAARQASLSITNSQSLLKPMSKSWWCHPTISSSVVPFSSCLQSFPASGSFLMSQFFASGGHRIGVSASASVLPMNIQDWFSLGWTGWIALQSKGLSSLLQHHSLKASILWCSALFMVHFSYP